MPVQTSTEIETLNGRLGEDRQLADAEDISGGVETEISDVTTFTLFLDVNGAVDLTVELSPDGDSWYEPRTESPVSFSGENTDIYLMRYDATAIRLTGNNGTAVTAQVREVV